MSKHRTAAQWQALVDQQHDSGLSALKFCQQLGIGYASFRKWRTHLSGTSLQQRCEASSASDPGFLDLSSLLMDESNASGPSWHIVLSLGNGVELRLSQGG